MKAHTANAGRAGAAGEIVKRRKGARTLSGPELRVAAANRRGAARYRTFKGGRVIWPSGDSVTCIIRNLSETGALLEVHSPVPADFELVFDAGQPPRECHVMWQKPNRVGVRFA